MRDSENPPPSPPAAAADLDTGLAFVHTMEMQTKNELFEIAATLAALVHELTAKGVIDTRALAERREHEREHEAERFLRQTHVSLSDKPDKYALPTLPAIDCAARIELCKSRCCRMTFSLSRQDLDEHVVRWDYSRPYRIRRKSDGYCVHNAEATRSCEIYDQRPATCRTYDCRTDKRVWIDFDKRIPAL